MPKNKPAIALSLSALKEAENAAEVLAYRDLIRERLAREPYPPGYVVSTRWQSMIDQAMDQVASMDAVGITLRGLGSGDFDVGLPPADVEHIRKMRDKHVAWHPELADISETPLAPPNSTADCGNGITFSHSLEQTFDFYNHLIDGIGTEALSHVIEIGSGCGRLIRVLKLAGRAKHFTLVDLPQSLLSAFAFLRLSFPDAKLKAIGSRADIYPGMERDFDFVFCPIQFLSLLRPADVDLVVNTYSFGEMQQGCVDHIMSCVHGALAPRFLFSLNTIFVDKNMHYAESGGTGEGNEIVLKLEPVWWPKTFRLHKSPERDSWRSEVATVLQRVAIPEHKLVGDLIEQAAKHDRGSDMWLGLMYCAAMWTLNRATIDAFFDGLRDRLLAEGFDRTPDYKFDKIGEVQFLRRRSDGIAAAAEIVRREHHQAQWSIQNCVVN